MSHPVEGSTIDISAIARKSTLPDHQLFTLTSRVHLFWLLMEDLIRKEVVYTKRSAETLQTTLKSVMTSIDIIDGYMNRVSNKEVQNAKTIIQSLVENTKTCIQKGIDFLSDESKKPVSKIFYAQQAIHDVQGRFLLELRLLNEQTSEMIFPMMQSEDVKPAGNISALLEEKIKTLYAVEYEEDALEKCNATRGMNAALYFSMALDPAVATDYAPKVSEIEFRISRDVPPNVRHDYLFQQAQMVERMSGKGFDEHVDMLAQHSLQGSR